MRRGIAIALFIVFSLNALFKLGLVAKYYLNFEYYAKVLCINQDKPPMGCKGQCHLKKELKQAEKKSDDGVPEIAFKLNLSFFIINATNNLQFAISKEFSHLKQLQYPVFDENILTRHTSALLRPPIV